METFDTASKLTVPVQYKPLNKSENKLPTPECQLGDGS